jgi:serine/threonine protein kinase
MNIGDIVGQYTILDKIGEGGMGCVLKVIDNTTRKNFALKYCKDRDEKSIGRFKREVKFRAHSSIFYNAISQRKCK